MKIMDLFESFDLEQSLEYKESSDVVNAVKESYPELYPHGYIFKFEEKLFATYTFVRNGSLEIHFYDATNGIATPKREINVKYSIKVLTTVTKILFDELNKRNFKSITIGFTESNKNLYIKMIKKLISKYDKFKEYDSEIEIVNLPSGNKGFKMDCVNPEPMIECIIQFDSDGNRVF